MLALSVSTTYAENNEQKRGKSFFSLDIGGGYGKMWSKYLLEDQMENIYYELDYNKTLSLTADLEFQYDGFISMFEANYFKASYDKFESVLDPTFLDPDRFEDVNLYEAAFYVGGVINSRRRFQMPIMVGFNVGYALGEPLHNVTGSFAYKIRAKYYLTNNIGLYLGFCGTYGGARLRNRYGNEKDEHGKYTSVDVKQSKIGLEAGLTIMLGRKK